MPAHAWILPPKWAPVTFESTCSWRLLRPIPFPSRASHVCALADEAGYGRRRRGALGRRKQDGGRDSARGSGAVLPTELEGTAANPGRSQAAGAAAAAVAAAAASNPHQVVASFIRAIQPGVGSHVGGRNETGSCRAYEVDGGYGRRRSSTCFFTRPLRLGSPRLVSTSNVDLIGAPAKTRACVGH